MIERALFTRQSFFSKQFRADVPLIEGKQMFNAYDFIIRFVSKIIDIVTLYYIQKLKNNKHKRSMSLVVSSVPFVDSNDANTWHEMHIRAMRLCIHFNGLHFFL